MKVSKRTKNRIREHGEHLTFDFTKINDNVCGFDGVRMVFATCDKCGWFGWLPMSEVQ